jgi:hypothetical protein
MSSITAKEVSVLALADTSKYDVHGKARRLHTYNMGVAPVNAFEKECMTAASLGNLPHSRSLLNPLYLNDRLWPLIDCTEEQLTAAVSPTILEGCCTSTTSSQKEWWERRRSSWANLVKVFMMMWGGFRDLGGEVGEALTHMRPVLQLVKDELEEMFKRLERSGKTWARSRCRTGSQRPRSCGPRRRSPDRRSPTVATSRAKAAARRPMRGERGRQHLSSRLRGRSDTIRAEKMFRDLSPFPLTFLFL